MRFRFAYIKVVVTGLIFSCSIIDDSDITSEEEFKKLKVKSIDIVQQTATKSSTSTIQVTLDTTVNISSVNGTLTRYVEMSLNNFSSSKLKFASGTTSSKLTMFEYFLSDGRPHSFGIMKDTVLELYRFRYNDQKKLMRINFFLGEGRLVNSDSIVYNNSGRIGSIVRKAYEDASKNGTLTVSYGGGFTVSISQFALGSYQYQQTGGSCPNGGVSGACSGYMRTNTGGGGNAPQVTLKKVGVQLTEEVSLEDIRNNGNGGGREPDSYYFHPLLLLQESFTNGNDLAVIYLIDWWSIGAQTGSSTSSTQDERVTFKFNYAL